QGSEVGHGASADEQTTRLFVQVQDLPDPIKGEPLELDRGGGGTPGGEIGVQSGSEQIGESGDSCSRSLHVTEHARVRVMSAQRYHALESCEQFIKIGALHGQGAVELLANLLRRSSWIDALLRH